MRGEKSGRKKRMRTKRKEQRKRKLYRMWKRERRSGFRFKAAMLEMEQERKEGVKKGEWKIRIIETKKKEDQVQMKTNEGDKSNLRKMKMKWR